MYNIPFNFTAVAVIYLSNHFIFEVGVSFQKVGKKIRAEPLSIDIFLAIWNTFFLVFFFLRKVYFSNGKASGLKRLNERQHIVA